MLVKINGRTVYTSRVTAVKKTRPGHYQIETEAHGTFDVEGGRAAGGTSREWFLDHPKYFSKSIHCTSLMDAVHCVENL